MSGGDRWSDERGEEEGRQALLTCPGFSVRWSADWEAEMQHLEELAKQVWNY